MHFHGPPINFNVSNLYAAHTAEKAEEARKAADVRRRLMKAGAEVDGDSADFESLLIGQRSGDGSPQNRDESQAFAGSSADSGQSGQSGQQGRSAKIGNSGKFDEAAAVSALSIWA